MDKLYTNKSNTIYFSVKNYQPFIFYHSVISTKSLMTRILLKIIINTGIHRPFFYISKISKVKTISKIGKNSQDIITAIEENFFCEWYKYFDCKRPKEVSYLVVKKGDRELLFFFADNSPVPFSFAKVESIKKKYSPFLNEFEKLKSIRKEVAIDLKASLPRPLFKIERSDKVAIIVSYLDGMLVNPSGKKFMNTINCIKDRKVFQKVYEFWKKFSGSLNSKEYFDKQLFDEYLRKNELIFFSSFPNEISMKKEFAYLRKKLKQTHMTSKCVGNVHGDFWKGNLIYKNKSIHVVDWERSKKIGFPIYDIFLFCVTFYDENDIAKSLSKIFLEDTYCNMLIREVILKASKHLSLDGDLAKVMFEAFLIEMCIQGPIHYKRKSKFDVVWKTRLDFFLKNKENILNKNFSIL